MADEPYTGATTDLAPEREGAALRALGRLAGAWAANLGEAASFELVSHELATLLPCDRIYLLRPNGLPLSCQERGPGARAKLTVAGAYRGETDSLQPGQSLFGPSPLLELPEGNLDLMVCSDTVCWSTGLEHQLAEEGLRSALGIVLRREGTAVGVLVMASRRVRAYGPGEVRLLRRMSLALAEYLGPRQPAATRQAEPESRENVTEHGLLSVTGSLSRYFNQLLAYLLGGLELLREDGSLAPEVLLLLTRMEERAAEGAGVVRALQQFAAETPAEGLQEIELTELVDEALNETDPACAGVILAPGQKLVTWHQRVPGRRVCGNRRELREALINVLLNAAQAMPQGGILRVTEGTEGSWNYVEVRDPGEGMSRETLQRAQEPFFTTRRGRRRGLGLSVTAGILRRHGGEVSLTSEPGQGTTVRLNFLALRS